LHSTQSDSTLTTSPFSSFYGFLQGPPGSYPRPFLPSGVFDQSSNRRGISKQVPIDSQLCDSLVTNFTLMLLTAILCQITTFDAGRPRSSTCLPDPASLIIWHDRNTSHQGRVSRDIRYFICAVSLRSGVEYLFSKHKVLAKIGTKMAANRLDISAQRYATSNPTLKTSEI